MDRINGYPIEGLHAELFSRLSNFTSHEISRRLEGLRLRLQQVESKRERHFISLGENCAVATRLRMLGAPTMGSSFFDNIVIRKDGLTNLLNHGFNNILALSNLSIGSWEGHDSVFDKEFGIYFHHYFHLRGEREKSRCNPGSSIRIRRIDEEDIPLFLAAVRAQFEYLQKKFALVATADFPKEFVLRKVDGSPVESDFLSNLDASLRRFGAQNYRISVIYAFGEPETKVRDSHYFIKEVDQRWGETEAWGEFVRSRS